MIYYIGSYCRTAVEDNMFISPAASSKMEYIADLLHEICEFSLVSLCCYKLHSFKIIRHRVIKLDSVETDYIMPSLGSRFKIIRALNNVVLFVYLLYILLIKVNKTDTVILYHSLNYIIPTILSKRLKNYKLIVEAEEIYTDVCEKLKFLKKFEFSLFDSADSFICPSYSLLSKINSNSKPYLMSYGVYKCNDLYVNKIKDGATHCVYAGTFDRNKGGVYSAISAAEYLDDNYMIHIIGFGKSDDIDYVLETINLTSRNTDCKIVYDGLLTGQDYIEYLQKCDIGLSTQNPIGEYNNTSFPSKIFSYLSNGLKVVSVRIPVVESSPIGNDIFYYDVQDGKHIADAIIKASTSVKDSRSLLNRIDIEFKNQLLDFI